MKNPDINFHNTMYVSIQVYPWAEDFALQTYPNLETDGIQALQRTILMNPGLTLIELAPMTNLHALMEEYPRLRLDKATPAPTHCLWDSSLHLALDSCQLGSFDFISLLLPRSILLQ